MYYLVVVRVCDPELLSTINVSASASLIIALAMARQLLNQFLNRTVFMTCKLKVVTVHGETHSGTLDWAISSMQGRRESMEDAHCVMTDARPGAHVFATFDGHRGAETAIFAAQALPTLLKTAELASDSASLSRTLRDAFHGIDRLLADACHPGPDRTLLMEDSYLTGLVSSRLRGSARVEQLEQAADEEGWCSKTSCELPHRPPPLASGHHLRFVSRVAGTRDLQDALQSSQSSMRPTAGSLWPTLATRALCFAVRARPLRSVRITSRAWIASVHALRRQEVAYKMGA